MDSRFEAQGDWPDSRLVSVKLETPNGCCSQETPVTQGEAVLIYFDDVISFSHTFEELLEMVFDRLRQHGFKLKPRKCHLLREEVGYLEHIVLAQGIATDPNKIQQVKVLKDIRETNINAAVLDSALEIKLQKKETDIWRQNNHPP
ncbi:unnamed protein product [Caretta caretta]